MTKGEYNACGGKGSFKTFGSTGQGWDKLGVKDDNSGEDEPRTMLVTIRAKKQVKRKPIINTVKIANVDYQIVSSSGEDPITLTAGSYEFTDTNAYSSAGLDSGAIKTTISLVAALIALAASI